MSGKPGRSGGARPNSGPKRKPPAQVLPAADEKPTDSAPAGELEPLEFLRQVMLGVIDPSPSQLKAAIAAAQYCHAKVGEGGKKEQAANPHTLQKLDYGIFMVGGTAIINYFSGALCVRTGKRNNSLALIASGKHLQSDTYTTAGIIAGLLLLFFTGIAWIDSAVAIIFSFIIIFTGYKIIRSSIAGIMDETDMDLLKRMVETLEKNRHVNWVDLHNLRIIKYGPTLHLDCHLTVPWYLTVHEAHKEIDALSSLVRKDYGESVELFVHSDGCLDYSCRICEKTDCPQRKQAFEKRIPWTMNNISTNHKHTIDS